MTILKQTSHSQTSMKIGTLLTLDFLFWVHETLPQVPRILNTQIKSENQFIKL